jgi:hypothetical protein
MKTKLLLVLVLVAGVIAALGRAGQPEQPAYPTLDALPAMVGVADEHGRPVKCGGKELKVPRDEVIGPPPPHPFVVVGPPSAGEIAERVGARRDLKYRCGLKGEPVLVPAE